MNNFKKNNFIISLIVIIVLIILLYLINKHFIQSNFGTIAPPAIDSTTCDKVCNWPGNPTAGFYPQDWVDIYFINNVASCTMMSTSGCVASIRPIYRDGSTGPYARSKTDFSGNVGPQVVVKAQLGGYVLIILRDISSGGSHNISKAWKIPVNLDLLNCKDQNGFIVIRIKGGMGTGAEQYLEVDSECWNDKPRSWTTDYYESGRYQGIDACRLKGNVRTNGKEKCAAGETCELESEKEWYNPGGPNSENTKQGELEYKSDHQHPWNGTLPPACCSAGWYMPGTMTLNTTQATAAINKWPNVQPYTDCCSAGTCPKFLCGGFGYDMSKGGSYVPYPGGCPGFDTFRRPEEETWMGAWGPYPDECNRYEPGGCLPYSSQQYFGGPLVPFGSGEAQWGTGGQPDWVPRPGWPACEGKQFNGFELRLHDKTGATDLMGCPAGYRQMSMIPNYL